MQMLSSKDVNFVGYTYKNFEIVQDANVPGVGEFLVPLNFFPMRIVFRLSHFYFPPNLS